MSVVGDVVSLAAALLSQLTVFQFSQCLTGHQVLTTALTDRQCSIHF